MDAGSGDGVRTARVRSPTLRRTHRERKAGAKRLDAGRGRFHWILPASALGVYRQISSQNAEIVGHPWSSRGRRSASSLEDDPVFVQFACGIVIVLFSVAYENGIGLAIANLADLSQQGRST